MPRTKAPETLEEVISAGVARLQHDINSTVNGMMYNAFKESMNGRQENGSRRVTRRKRRNGKRA